MDDAELLRTFDRQIRRLADPAPGFVVELVDEPAPMLRLLPTETAAWGGGVFWCDLDESTAAAAIADTLAAFAGTGRPFEWKYYGYDRPADLQDRLRAAGFEPDEDEALVVGEVAVVRERLAGAPAPAGVTIRRLHEDEPGRGADWAGIAALNTAIWDEDSTEYVRGLAAAFEADPAAMSMWVAAAEDATIVCAARANFHQGTDFTSLWGGGTLAAYRGRGIYKALVSRRADEAAERGHTFLQVDASPDSRPILERLGLRSLAVTTPWMWRP